jgi:DNA transposition AAA+ family ATPase
MAAKNGLGRFLDRLDLTQEQCASGAGVDQATVSRVVNGRGSPSSATLARIKRWADRQASRQKLPMDQRLTWDDLHASRTKASA